MLAISTVTKEAFIAVSYDGKNFFSEIEADCRQSENILAEIDKILQKNDIPFKEIGNIAVLIGPGSFTGIRIGISLVKGLCAGSQSHKVIPISTLDLMAKAYKKEYSPNEEFACMLNALSGRFFVAKYDKNGKKIMDEKMIFQDDVSSLSCDLVVLEEEIEILPGVKFTPELLLEYAEEMEKAGEFTTADKLVPLYIRKAQAEENLD